MSADHTIPDDIATSAYRLINAAEDMRQQATDDLKQIYADLREDLKGLGWAGSAISVEVAALKGAIVEMRLDDEKKSKRDEKSERIDGYVLRLSRARAREGRSYADAKGGFVTTPKASVSMASSDETVDFVTTSFNPETGEVIEDQPETETGSGRPAEAPLSKPAASLADEIARTNPHSSVDSSSLDKTDSAGTLMAASPSVPAASTAWAIAQRKKTPVAA